jgi:hypothetical protein
MMVAAFSAFLIIFTVLFTISARNFLKYIVKSS